MLAASCGWERDPQKRLFRRAWSSSSSRPGFCRVSLAFGGQSNYPDTMLFSHSAQANDFFRWENLHSGGRAQRDDLLALCGGKWPHLHAAWMEKPAGLGCRHICVSPFPIQSARSALALNAFESTHSKRVDWIAAPSVKLECAAHMQPIWLIQWFIFPNAMPIFNFLMIDNFYSVLIIWR